MKHASLFIMISFLLVSCGSGNTLSATSTALPISTSTAMPSPSPTPIPVLYVYGDEVSAGERAEIELSMQWTYRYLSELDLGSPGLITVYAFDDAQKLTDISWPIFELEYHSTSKDQLLLDWQNSGGNAAPGAIFVKTSFPAWTVDDPCSKVETPAHETWHIMQRQWYTMPLLDVGGGPVPSFGPEWLLEGSAEVFAWKVTAQAHPGLCDYDNNITMRGYALYHAPDLSSLVSSTAMSDAQAAGFFYDLSYIAVDYLIRESPKGIESVKDFYQDIGQGLPWEQVFQDAFGQSVDTFYSEFAVYNPWQ